MVGLNARQLFCIVCKSPDLYPQVRQLTTFLSHILSYVNHILTLLLLQVVPKPVLTLLNFSILLASSDLGAEALENVFILNNMHLVEVCPFVPPD